MKKTLCIILALCLVLALGACSKAPAAQASPGNAAPAGQQSAAVSDTSTVAVGAVILARDDVSEDQIYAFVSNIFDNVATITEQHAKGGELDLKFAAGVTSVPYHPGAAKYFAEKGVTVAAVKEGAGTGAKGNLTFGISSNVMFLSSAMKGDCLRAEAVPVNDHRRIPSVEVRVTNQDGRLICHVTGMGYRKEISFPGVKS